MGTVRHAGVGKKFVSKRREHQAGFRREGQLLLKFGVLRACLARVNGWSCPPHAGQHSSPTTVQEQEQSVCCTALPLRQGPHADSIATPTQSSLGRLPLST